MMEIVRYCVNVQTINNYITKKFLTWMKEEHGSDLLKIDGCISYKIYQFDTNTLSCEYIFNSQDSLDKYFKNDASKLRKKGAIIFSENEIIFSRKISKLLVSEKL